MISVSEFKLRCANDSANDIVESVFLGDEAAHVSSADHLYMVSRLAKAFGVKQETLKLLVVGSAKLGFSIVEKNKPGLTLPRYRKFGPTSDIDTAVICPGIFQLIWNDLSIFAHGWSWMPWDSGRLGDYLVHGWLRPDHFPKRLRYCDLWWDQFRLFSLDSRFKRHQVRGGLFNSLDDLKRYLRRGVTECINAEKKSP